MFPEFPVLHFKFCLNFKFFLWNNCLLLVFSYTLCLLGLYVTSNVVRLMFIAYFSLMSLTMMVFSACVNDTVHLLYTVCYYVKAACDGLWFSVWLSHHHLHLVVISVFQRYKTNFRTLIGWYINIISVNEITVFNCKVTFKGKTVKPKMLLPYISTTAAVLLS